MYALLVEAAHAVLSKGGAWPGVRGSSRQNTTPYSASSGARRTVKLHINDRMASRRITSSRETRVAPLHRQVAVVEHAVVGRQFLFVLQSAPRTSPMADTCRSRGVSSPGLRVAHEVVTGALALGHSQLIPRAGRSGPCRWPDSRRQNASRHGQQLKLGVSVGNRAHVDQLLIAAHHGQVAKSRPPRDRDASHGLSQSVGERLSARGQAVD